MEDEGVEVADPAMEQVIEQELAPLNGEELAGIWRSLCAMMLLRTANLLHCHHANRKQNACQRQTALRWVHGETGIITFSSACETLDLSEEYAKTGLLKHAGTRARPSINRESSDPDFGNYQPCLPSQRKSVSCSSGRRF